MKTITLPAIAFLFLIPALLGILPNAAYAVNDQPPPAPTEDYDPFGDGQDENGLIPDDNGEDIDEELGQVVFTASLPAYLCHATGNGGYVQQFPNTSGQFHGHIGHQDGADIIPPFEHEGTVYSQNWPSAIWDAGCTTPATATPTATDGPCDPQVCGVTATEVPTETASPTPTPSATSSPTSTVSSSPTATSTETSRESTPTSTATEFNQPEDPTPTRETEIVTTLPDTGSGPNDDGGMSNRELALLSVLTFVIGVLLASVAFRGPRP